MRRQLPRVRNWLLITLGSMLFAAGMTIFVVPNHFAPGGLSGVATMINALFPRVPIGVVTFAFTGPLLVLAARYINKTFVLATLYASVVFSCTVDLLGGILPVYTGDRLLAALFGGAVMGVGFGLTIQGGASTGGTDIVGILCLRRFPQLSIGTILLLFDVAVISASLLVFREVEAGMYAIICMAVASKVMDILIYGAEDGKMLMLVSQRCDEIADEIMRTLDRSATILTAEGAYSKAEKKMLISVVDNKQTIAVKKMVRSIDPTAFVFIVSVSTVEGEGWINHTPSAAWMM